MAKMLVQTSMSDHSDDDLSSGSPSKGEGLADIGGDNRDVVDGMKEGCHGAGEGG